MSTPIGNGWQAILADLSLILFMLTASVLQAPKPDTVLPSPPSPTGSPVAIYRADPGAPPIADWLKAQARDRRTILTITVRYRPGGQAAAIAAGAALAEQAATAGKATRVIVEPGQTGWIDATLGYDSPVDS